MRKIPKPTDDPKSVYLTSTSKIKDKVLKQQLQAVAGEIGQIGAAYNQKAEAGELYLLEKNKLIGGISKEEMEKIYTDRMAKKGAPSRHIYERIKQSSPHNCCPLCGHGTVSTLDHYLPKANFTTLVVMPYNLIPACSDCNKIKSNVVPSNAESQTLHPYYDDVTQDQWLYAEVSDTAPLSINFEVRPPQNWDDVKKARVLSHFNQFKLADLYRNQAVVAIGNIRARIIKLYDISPPEVTRHLQEEYESCRDNHVNSWQTAMYQALANSSYFSISTIVSLMILVEN